MFAADNLVEGNRFYDNAVGVYLMYTGGRHIRNNLFSHANGADRHGRRLQGGLERLIEGNEIIYCAVGVGSDLSPFQPDTTINSAATASPTTASASASPRTGRQRRQNNVFEGNLTHVARAAAAAAAQRMARQLLGRLPGLRPRPRQRRRHAARAVRLYADQLWMEMPQARFFKNAPVMELLDFLERLAPFSTPDLMLKDEKPRFQQAPGERKRSHERQEGNRSGGATAQRPAPCRGQGPSRRQLAAPARRPTGASSCAPAADRRRARRWRCSGYLPLVYARTPRLRPPGALEEKDFLASCIKCGQCVQVCPVAAIKLADIDDGFGVGVPYIDAREQACDFSCDAVQCILACPTGSLTYTSRRSLDVPAPLARQADLLKAKENDPEPTLNLSERIGVARLTRPESCLAVQGQGLQGPGARRRFPRHLRYVAVDRWKPVPVATTPTTRSLRPVRHRVPDQGRHLDARRCCADGSRAVARGARAVRRLRRLRDDLPGRAGSDRRRSRQVWRT
jgi:ferredoxin-type protein NapG